MGYFPENQMASLQQTVPHYSLCQNLTLEISQNYDYSFDVAIHPNVVQSTIKVSINDQQIATFYKYNTTKTTLSKVNGSFMASTISVRFCVASV